MRRLLLLTAIAACALQSQTIDIEASASMTIKAGATLTIQGTLVKIN